jgi:fumarate reductase flavoprotein subunit
MAMGETGYKIGENVFCFEFPQVDGSGLRMAWEVGAGHTNVLMDTYVSLPNPFAGPGGTLYELGSFRQPSLMVNAEGERFMDEAVLRMPSYAGNAVKRQTGGCAYMLFDERINRYYQDNRWDHYISGIGYDRSGNIGPFIQKAMADGEKHLCVANTLDDAADFMGIDKIGLNATVQAYNAMCAAGSDTLFYKQREYLRPLSEPPFYAARFYVSAYGTLGGIAVNYRTEVLNESRAVIPGLYAVGNDANALYGDTYPFFFSGNTSAFCYNSGRIAGENASVFVKNQELVERRETND